jgi:hypothetical protein
VSSSGSFGREQDAGMASPSPSPQEDGAGGQRDGGAEENENGEIACPSAEMAAEGDEGQNNAMDDGSGDGSGDEEGDGDGDGDEEEAPVPPPAPARLGPSPRVGPRLRLLTRATSPPIVRGGRRAFLPGPQEGEGGMGSHRGGVEEGSRGVSAPAGGGGIALASAFDLATDAAFVPIHAAHGGEIV